MVRRYAIYVTPDGPLGAAGAAWLGWDIANGRAVEHPQVGKLDLREITKRPRKYGFHATIKPPMVLAEGATSEELIQAAGVVARSAAPIVLNGLTVSWLGRFLALKVKGNVQPLEDLAATFVEKLDMFRATPTDGDLNRHRNTLSVRQEQNLTQWGYPHVMQDFHFHITLTGPLKDAQEVLPQVADHFAPVLPAPYIIDHLSVAGEDEDGMFHTLARLPLRG